MDFAVTGSSFLKSKPQTVFKGKLRSHWVLGVIPQAWPPASTPPSLNPLKVGSSKLARNILHSLGLLNTLSLANTTTEETFL